jgi:hypothetical protein
MGTHGQRLAERVAALGPHATLERSSLREDAPAGSSSCGPRRVWLDLTAAHPPAPRQPHRRRRAAGGNAYIASSPTTKTAMAERKVNPPSLSLSARGGMVLPNYNDRTGSSAPGSCRCGGQPRASPASCGSQMQKWRRLHRPSSGRHRHQPDLADPPSWSGLRVVRQARQRSRRHAQPLRPREDGKQDWNAATIASSTWRRWPP